MGLPDRSRKALLVLTFFGAGSLSCPSVAELPGEVRLALAGRDYVTAVAWLIAHADEPDAAFELGKLYRLGQGVDKDPDRAADLFALAAQDGNADAHYMLGKHHERIGDTDIALRWMRSAAARDHPRAESWVRQNSAARADTPGGQYSLFDTFRSGALPPEGPLTSQMDVRDEFGRTLLMEAVEAGSEPWVGYLVNSGARLDDQDPLGNTALHFAIRQGNRSIAELLLEAGAIPDIPAQDGSTPLHIAIAAGEVSQVQTLLAHDANTTLPNTAGWTPATLASRSDNKEIRSAFGISSSTANRRLTRLSELENSEQSLADAARKGDVELITRLLDRGDRINAPDTGGIPPLAHAVRHGQLNAVRLLIRRGARTDIILPDGQSLLHVAASAGQPETLAAILTNDASIDVQDSAGQTPLMVAVQSACGPCEAMLLEKGAGADIQDQRGQTALIVSLRSTTLATSLQLIERARNLDLQDLSGRNALWWATRTGQEAAVRALIARNAPLAVDNGKVSPLHLAAEGDYTAITDLLIPLSDLNAQSDSGNTPLLRAAHNGSANATAALINAGAKFEIRNAVGDTALIAAVRSGDVKSAELLLNAGASPRVRNQRFESALSLIEAREEPEWQALLKSANRGLFGMLQG